MKAILWEIIEEHLDEAEFLLEQWCAGARSPRFTHGQLVRMFERRLLAHLDGLFLGGPEVATRVLWPALDDGPRHRRAAAALALVLEGDVAPLLEKLATADDEARAALGLALQLSAHPQLDESLRAALYTTDHPGAQRTLLEALAARRLDAGPILATLIAGDDAALAAAALGAARPEHRHLVEAQLGHRDAACRRAAVAAGLSCQLRAAWRACLDDAEAGSAEALLLVGLSSGPLEVLIDALAHPERRKAALWALGFTGRVEAVEAALPFLDDADPEVAALAGEVLAATAGLPLDDAALRAEPVEDDDSDELPPLEEDLQRDLRGGPLDDLPRPRADAVRRWWQERRGSLDPKRRYLRGVPFADAIATAFVTTPLLRREPLATELAIRSSGELQVPALRLGATPPAIPPLKMESAPYWR